MSVVVDAAMPAERDVVARVSWPQALAWRMHRQHLLTRAGPADLVAVAARLCGLHAQLSSSAELTLWARVDGLPRDAVADALWRQRSLVKLWGMRGTLHLLPAAELGLWLAAFGTYRDYRVTDAAVVELVDAVGTALHGELRTRTELAVEVKRRTGSGTLAERIQGSWGTQLKPVSFGGKLCFAPSDGRHVRFTHPASWVPGGVAEVAEDHALVELTRRYLAAFAPATSADLARWWGVGPARAVRMCRALGAEVVEVDVAGDRCWVLAAHVPELVRAAPVKVVRLLPAFDQWVVGASRTAAGVLDPAHRARVYRGQGWLSPVLLVSGRVSGVWQSRRQGGRLLVEIAPFGRLPAWARTGAEAEAVRLAGFLGGALTLTWLE